MTNDIKVETELHHYAYAFATHTFSTRLFTALFGVICQQESSYTIRLPGHIYSTVVSLVLHQSKHQTELFDLFSDFCTCNSGVSREKLQEFLRDLLLFRKKIYCNLCCTVGIKTHFAFRASFAVMATFPFCISFNAFLVCVALCVSKATGINQEVDEKINISVASWRRGVVASWRRGVVAVIS